MNKRFSLSFPLARALPEAMEADGVSYAIRPDFRVILKIYRLLGDLEIEERHKPGMACRMFYAGEWPPEAYLRLLEWFALGPPVRKDPHAPPMDFEFDADVIYASFWQRYGIDLLRVEYLHWYSFLVLLRGLGEGTALSARLYARGRDTSKLKGKDKQSADIAKQNAQIPKRISSAEEAIQARIAQVLMQGGDVRELLRDG